MTGRTSTGLQPSLSSAAEKDEVYYWDSVRFLVEGIIFKLPRYQFTVGSEYFAKTYLQDVPRCLTPDADPDDEWDSMDVTDAPRLRISTAGAVHLEGVTAAQFRTFLKLLFPIHSTTTTLTLTKAEWLTVLALSTRWHFLELRKLAMEHLNTQIQMADAVEMITVGRVEYVSKWVEGGYGKLVVKKEAISEEESERVGWRTAVKLYIVRHKLAGSDKNMKTGEVREAIRVAFSDEFATLKGQERERRTREETRIEEDQENLKLRQEEERNMKEEEAQRLIAEAARRAKEEVLETKRAKDEERRGEEERRQEEQQRTEQRKIEEDADLDSEQMRQLKKAAKKAKKAMAKQVEQEALKRGTSSDLATSTGQDGKQCQDDQENDGTDSDEFRINAGERDDKAQEQKYDQETAPGVQNAAAEENAAAEKWRREAEREALIQQKLEEELEMIMADAKRREEEKMTAERKRQEEEKEAAERRRQGERRAARREEQRQAAALSLRKQQAEAAWAARAQPPKTLMAGFIERVLPHAQAPAVSEKATWEASFKTPFGTSRAS